MKIYLAIILFNLDLGANFGGEILYNQSFLNSNLFFLKYGLIFPYDCDKKVEVSFIFEKLKNLDYVVRIPLQDTYFLKSDTLEIPIEVKAGQDFVINHIFFSKNLSKNWNAAFAVYPQNKLFIKIDGEFGVLESLDFYIDDTLTSSEIPDLENDTIFLKWHIKGHYNILNFTRSNFSFSSPLFYLVFTKNSGKTFLKIGSGLQFYNFVYSLKSNLGVNLSGISTSYINLTDWKIDLNVSSNIVEDNVLSLIWENSLNGFNFLFDFGILHYFSFLKLFANLGFYSKTILKKSEGISFVYVKGLPAYKKIGFSNVYVDRKNKVLSGFLDMEFSSFEKGYLDSKRDENFQINGSLFLDLGIGLRIKSFVFDLFILNRKSKFKLLSGKIGFDKGRWQSGFIFNLQLPYKDKYALNLFSYMPNASLGFLFSYTYKKFNFKIVPFINALFTGISFTEGRIEQEDLNFWDLLNLGFSIGLVI